MGSVKGKNLVFRLAYQSKNRGTVNIQKSQKQESE